MCGNYIDKIPQPRCKYRQYLPIERNIQSCHTQQKVVVVVIVKIFTWSSFFGIILSITNENCRTRPSVYFSTFVRPEKNWTRIFFWWVINSESFSFIAVLINIFYSLNNFSLFSKTSKRTDRHFLNILLSFTIFFNIKTFLYLVITLW